MNSKELIIGIDASNLRTGGGMTHIIELIRNIDSTDNDIKKIIIYGGSSVHKIPQNPKVEIKYIEQFDGNFLVAAYWKLVKLSNLLKKDNVDILFNPGGSYIGTFRPFVTMSRNMLPFEKSERIRYGRFSALHIKFLALNIVQRWSFSTADGVIFLSNHAKDTICLNTKIVNSAIIPHGISSRFENNIPNQCVSIAQYSEENPFKIVYVSIIDMYKHQWNVAEAVSLLRKKGYPVELILVGGKFEPAYKKLQNIIDKIDPKNSFIKYLGLIPYEEIDLLYKKSDLFVFSSTCENMPNILIEAMTSGLPIACSNHAPMPEFLKDAGVYFDPLSVESTAEAIETCLKDVHLREDIAKKAKQYAQLYAWSKCAKETMAFIKQC